MIGEISFLKWKRVSSIVERQIKRTNILCSTDRVKIILGYIRTKL